MGAGDFDSPKIPDSAPPPPAPPPNQQNRITAWFGRMISHLTPREGWSDETIASIKNLLVSVAVHVSKAWNSVFGNQNTPPHTQNTLPHIETPPREEQPPAAPAPQLIPAVAPLKANPEPALVQQKQISPQEDYITVARKAEALSKYPSNPNDITIVHTEGTRIDFSTATEKDILAAWENPNYNKEVLLQDLLLTGFKEEATKISENFQKHQASGRILISPNLDWKGQFQNALDEGRSKYTIRDENGDRRLMRGLAINLYAKASPQIQYNFLNSLKAHPDFLEFFLKDAFSQLIINEAIESQGGTIEDHFATTIKQLVELKNKTLSIDAYLAQKKELASSQEPSAVIPKALHDLSDEKMMEAVSRYPDNPFDFNFPDCPKKYLGVTWHPTDLNVEMQRASPVEQRQIMQSVLLSCFLTTTDYLSNAEENPIPDGKEWKDHLGRIFAEAPTMNGLGLQWGETFPTLTVKLFLAASKDAQREFLISLKEYPQFLALFLTGIHGYYQKKKATAPPIVQQLENVANRKQYLDTVLETL